MQWTHKGGMVVHGQVYKEGRGRPAPGRWTRSCHTFFHPESSSFPYRFKKLPATEYTMAPRVKLNSGHEMPIVGFGLWKVDNATCADTVYNAIKVGYRLFDGACGKSRELHPDCDDGVDPLWQHVETGTSTPPPPSQRPALYSFTIMEIPPLPLPTWVPWRVVNRPKKDHNEARG